MAALLAQLQCAEVRGCRARLRIHGKNFGLDFFPTTQVAFDLVISRDQLDKPMARAMCEILQSGKFLRALSCLPGYGTSGSGRIVAP